MNDLDYFRDLRPDDAISDADLHSIRSQLFGDRTLDAVQDTTGVDRIDGDPADTIPTPIDIGRHRRPQIPRMAVAAAAALLFVGGGVWVVNQRRDSAPDSVSEAIDSTGTTLDQSATAGHDGAAPTQPSAPDPGSTLPGSTAPAPPVAATGPYAVPLVGIDEPGWTVTDVYARSFDPSDQVVFLSEDRFDGAWFELDSQASDSTSIADFIGQPPVEGNELVDRNGVQVAIVPADGGIIAYWIAAPGQTASIFGWDMTKDQVLPLVDSADVAADGRVRLSAIPTGSVEASPEEYAALSTYADYRFAHTDGRTVEVNLSPGGARGLYQRQGSSARFAEEGRRPIMIGDESATIVDFNTDQYTPDPSNTVDPELASDEPSPPGQYRVDVLRGFWTWEFQAERFPSERALTDIVGITGPADQQTFDASLSDDIVLAVDRAATVDAMLADVPLPDGFDRSSLDTGFSESRYHVVAAVSGSVVCAWSREWLDARDAGDSDRQQNAVDAVASARDWAMLREIADEGAWSDSIWQIAEEFPSPILDQMTRSEADEYLAAGDGC